MILIIIITLLLLPIILCITRLIYKLLNPKPEQQEIQVRIEPIQHAHIRIREDDDYDKTFFNLDDSDEHAD